MMFSLKILLFSVLDVDLFSYFIIKRDMIL